MQIQRIQSNNTTFGTKFGKNLDNFIMSNRKYLSTKELMNIGRIKRNKYPNTILELEHATPREQKMFNYIYKINLHSDTIDRKNNIMSSLDCIPSIFQEYARGRFGGKEIITGNRFPIFIKNLKESTWISIAKHFEGNSLSEKIEEEVSQSKLAVEEYRKFEENYLARIEEV